MAEPDRFSPGEIEALARAIGQGAGLAAADAAILAECLVSADLHGVGTHGVSRLNIYVRRMQRGLIDPRAELRVEHTRRAVLAVDACDGLGQSQAVKTLDLLIPLARECGVASATIRRSQHFGALSYYCNRAAAQGLILLAMTNCEPSMSPEGACEAFFGTNPLAVSFPTGKGFPLRIDLATSIVARGNIIAAQKAGRPIPDSWALDSDGEPTTDAAAALAGTIRAMAGHKGAALAMMVEIFSGVLSGAAVGSQIGSMYKHLDRTQNVGHFFCLFDVAAFVDVGELKQRLDDMIDRVKACRRRPGVDEILVPGERSYRTAEQNRRRGISIGPETLQELETLAGEYQIPFDLKPLGDQKPLEDRSLADSAVRTKPGRPMSARAEPAAMGKDETKS